MSERRRALTHPMTRCLVHIAMNRGCPAKGLPQSTLRALVRRGLVELYDAEYGNQLSLSDDIAKLYRCCRVTARGNKTSILIRLGATP